MAAAHPLPWLVVPCIASKMCSMCWKVGLLWQSASMQARPNAEMPWGVIAFHRSSFLAIVTA